MSHFSKYSILIYTFNPYNIRCILSTYLWVRKKAKTQILSHFSKVKLKQTVLEEFEPKQPEDRSHNLHKNL